MIFKIHPIYLISIFSLTTLISKNKSLELLELTINDHISLVHSWLCANKLSLNKEKSNFVIFHPAQKKAYHNLQLHIHNKPIKYETEIKYLGVMLDNHLSWKSHISYIKKSNVILEKLVTL
jgi:hypothetical protein